MSAHPNGARNGASGGSPAREESTSHVSYTESEYSSRWAATESGTATTYSGYPIAPPESPHEQLERVAEVFAGARKPPQMHQVVPLLGGRVRFRCGGRCVTGPPKVDLAYNVFAWLSLIVPSSFFYWKCLPVLSRTIPWLPIVATILFVVTVVSFLLVSFTDPGIIPRHSIRLLLPGLKDEVGVAIGLAPEDVELDSVYFNADLMDRIDQIGYRWCPFCHMIQPPKAKHCRDCDCCVLRNDHHCPFVNNCIGQRNYVYFRIFLLAVGAFGVALLSGIGLWINEVEGSEGTGLPYAIRMILVWTVFTFAPLFFLCVSSLGCIHTMRVCRRLSTRETFFAGLRQSSLLHGDSAVTFPKHQAQEITEVTSASTNGGLVFSGEPIASS